MSILVRVGRLAARGGCYAAVVLLAHWLAYEVRFEFKVPREYQLTFAAFWPLDILLKLAFLYSFGQLYGLFRYFSIPDLLKIVYAMVAAVAALTFIQNLPTGISKAPRSVVFLNFAASVAAVTTVRLGFRVIRDRLKDQTANVTRVLRPVVIVGAGDVGANLAKELLNRAFYGMRPVAFLDDDSSKWGMNLHGVRVVGAPEVLSNGGIGTDFNEVIIAMPAAPAKRIGEVVRLAQQRGYKCTTVPSIDQLTTGRVRVSQLRPVEIQDLLGRDPVALDTAEISSILDGKVVMVTGGGGSIGSELCRQIASFGPKRLIILDQSEVQLFQIEQEMIGKGHRDVVRPVVADVIDEERLRQVFTKFSPEVVFHAAAHKHVPMMEMQPGEAIKNNFFGTARLATLAQEFRVERFVLISTDKAINPTNVMGATKRLAEMFVQSLHGDQSTTTKFISVRFGNVLGSSGSVVPTFTRQIAAGGPVTVTHPEVTRYFMTIPEAVGLVLQAGALGTGGEIFVLDMGKPVKIADLARQMIELSGLVPGEDIEIQFTGLRPGEKMFEEITHAGENMVPTKNQKIMRFVSNPPSLEDMRRCKAALRGSIALSEPNALKQRLKRWVPEYTPDLS